MLHTKVESNDMQIFNNPEFGQVRTVIINGEPWFVGKDVARALGYGEGKSLNNAVTNHVDGEDKGVTELVTPGGKQSMTIINESGLYALIFGSKLKSAKKFKRWVTSEVLPSIDKAEDAISYGGKVNNELPKSAGTVSCIYADFDDNDNRTDRKYQLIEVWM